MSFDYFEEAIVAEEIRPNNAVASAFNVVGGPPGAIKEGLLNRGNWFMWWELTRLRCWWRV